MRQTIITVLISKHSWNHGDPGEFTAAESTERFARSKPRAELVVRASSLAAERIQRSIGGHAADGSGPASRVNQDLHP
jgi:hypothetical protein